jgi:hypothetical protein
MAPAESAIKPADAGSDEDGVGEGADRRHGKDVPTYQTLAQHERVLGADGDDQARPEEKALDGGGEEVLLRH